MSFAPCPSCSRHVKTIETSCPFCKNALALLTRDASVPIVKHRMTRAAAYAFGASLAVTGCTTGNSPDFGDAGAEDGGRDGGVDDGGGPAPLYGAVPVDAGPDGPRDGGNIQPPYGAPAYGGPPTDGGI